MKNTIFPIFCLFFLFTLNVVGQNETWREYIYQLVEEENLNSDIIENMYEELQNLESNPLNLNTLKKEDLEDIPVLSNEEINQIFEFLKKNRPVMTVFELRNVRNLSYRTIQLIIPFFYVGEYVGIDTPDRISEDSRDHKLSDMLKFGRHDIQIRFDKTLTQRAGYGHFSDSILERYPNRKYRGEDFYNSLRYSLKHRDRVQMGFTAEKDAGEPLLKKGFKKGYDHYGFHLILNNLGKFKTLAIGDYKLSFGQGLILNNDFVGIKSWGLDNISRRTIKPKRHFSTAEYGFFRGSAALFEIKNISFISFYSNRLIDANISETGDITSFKTDGVHRTLLEISKKRNTREQVLGANINYKKNRFQTGINYVYYEYNKTHNPTISDYNRYYFRGSSNYNASADYSYQLPGFIFAGETAMSKNGSVATINSFQYRPSTTISLSFLHRHYPISYNALHAQAFAEGSRIQNEKGIYLGASFQPYKRLAINSYIDFIRYPWPKYGVDKPSKATDIYMLGTYNLTQDSNIEVRYKYKMKEKNVTDNNTKTKSVLPYDTHKLRLRYSTVINNSLDLRTNLDFARYKVRLSGKELGFMISQNVNYKPNNNLITNAFIALFNAETNNARVYSYERSLMSSFYMPSFYGKGIRYALSLRFELTKALSLSSKLGRTRYFNREVIGSGADQINGNSRTDLNTYIRWRF